MLKTKKLVPKKFKFLEVVYKIKSVNSKDENFKAIHLKNSFMAEGFKSVPGLIQKRRGQK